MDGQVIVLRYGGKEHKRSQHIYLLSLNCCRNFPRKQQISVHAVFYLYISSFCQPRYLTSCAYGFPFIYTGKDQECIFPTVCLVWHYCCQRLHQTRDQSVRSEEPELAMEVCLNLLTVDPENNCVDCFQSL